MSRVLLCTVAVLAASCVAAAPSGFAETIERLVAVGQLAPETAEEVMTAYRATFAGTAWWEPYTELLFAALIGTVLSVLGVRFLPQSLGGRGVPERTRQRRGRISGTPT